MTDPFRSSQIQNQLKKSFTSEADALCFDLEDSVASDRKAGARETVFQ
jgi:citrate lyase beta subunit